MIDFYSGIKSREASIRGIKGRQSLESCLKEEEQMEISLDTSFEASTDYNTKRTQFTHTLT